MGEDKNLSAGNSAPNSSCFGLGSISSAIQTITGSKWAEGAVRGATRKGSGEPLQHRNDPIPWKEVDSHASAESCWIVVKSKVSVGMCGAAVRSRSVLLFHGQDSNVQVYDVTHFAPSHPGGVAILQYGGRDASDVFAAFHAAETWSLLPKYCIGEVEVRCCVTPCQDNIV